MSKISDIQTALESLIETTLPDYVKLPDSYDSEDNAVINLEKGYSTGFGAGLNNSDNFCKGEIRVQRAMSFILTNTYTANLDPTYRSSLEKSMMDDHTAVLKAIECSDQLGGSLIVEYDFDSGIEYLTTEFKQFIIITTTISVDYIEGV